MADFYSGYNDARRRNEQRDAAQLGQVAQFLTLQGAMEDRAAKSAEIQRQSQFRQRMATAKTDEERAQIAMEAEGPKGVLSHLDRQERTRATNEQAKARLVQQATQFSMVRQQEQQRIDRLTNKDDRDAAQQNLNNQARAFELQLRGEYARMAGAQGADTIMGFRPRPVPTAPTMQSPAAAVAAPQRQIIQGQAPDEQAAVGAINAAGGAPMSIEIPSAQPAEAQPAVTPAPTNNLDARDLVAQRGATPQAISPVPGQGVPVVRTAQEIPMPKWVGSPKDIRKLTNDWNADIAKMSGKEAIKDAKIGVNLAGGRESVFINRVINSGAQAAADLGNVVTLPISSGRGIFGGRSQGKGLLEAGKESLATKMTTQEVQSYNVVATGFQRALAAIEGMGLAPTNALMHQMDGVIFKEGDTNMTKLLKLAQTRQIIDKGLEVIAVNPRVDEKTKKLVDDILNKVRKDVPFTPSEVLKLEGLQATNPNATMRDIMAQKKQAAQSDAPQGVDPKVWSHMTPDEKKLWQK